MKALGSFLRKEINPKVAEGERLAQEQNNGRKYSGDAPVNGILTNSIDGKYAYT